MDNIKMFPGQDVIIIRISVELKHTQLKWKYHFNTVLMAWFCGEKQ